MSWWEPDQMEMARLQYMIISSWDNEMRRKAVDALDLEQKWQTQSRDTNDHQL